MLLSLLLVFCGLLVTTKNTTGMEELTKPIEFKIPSFVSLEVKEEKKEVVEVKKVEVIKDIWKDAEVYEISAYDNGVKSTGKHKGDRGYGITRSGAKTVEGVTLSADWNILPEGTHVLIEGIGERIVQDTGSAIKGRKLDLYFDSYEDCIEFGRQKRRLIVLEDEG